jgi:nucleoside-diphosphate-sugar epimerase
MSEPIPRIVALTGGTGFIGSKIAQYLLADGWQVRALVRSSWPSPPPAGLTVIEGSLEDAASLNHLVEGTTAVVHCAGAVRAKKYADFKHVNVDGTARLAEAAANTGSRPIFLHISSLAARAPHVSPYAASKFASEKVVAKKLAKLYWFALRPPAVYGPGDRATLSIFQGINKGIAPIMGSYENRISLIYVDDLATAVTAALADPPPTGSVFEVSDGAVGGYTWRRIGEIAAQCLKKKIFYLRIPRLIMQIAAAANVGFSYLIGSAPILTQGKVRELFHANWACQDNPLTACTPWWPKIGIDEGFARTLAWYREQGWI